MGVAFYPVLEKSIAGVDPSAVDGKALSRHGRELARLAETLAVRPLMTFFGMDAAEFLADEGIEPEANWETGEKWFAAADGLKTVNALLDALAENPGAIAAAADAVADLRAFERVLEAARQHGVRWHLALDF